MGSIRTLLYSEPWANSAQHIEGSLKFDKDKVQYLRKTLGSGNTKTFTFSYWFNYVSTRGSSRYISTGYSVGGNSYGFYIGDNGNAITFNDSGTNSAGYNVRPSAVMRDRGWYHLVFNLDTTESNEDDRVRIYINGVQQLDFSTNTRPNQDATGNMNSNGLELTIGCWNYPAGGGYSDALEGHLSQFYHIDGQALDPSYFGFTDPLTNTWRPKKFRIEDAPTTSWGTNGFYLPFDGSNSMPIGYDQSGTGNNFTLRNLNGTVSIDKATGAFPFWNTVSGGNVASAGVRTDSYSPGQLVAAVPFNAGVAKDYSDKANGGSTAKTLSNTGSITFPITYRNFYDSTMYLANAQNQQLGFTASDDFEFTGDFCIECWFRPTDTSAGDGSLWVLQKTSGGEAYFAFNYDAADTLFNIYLNTGSVTWTPSSATVSFNEWNHTALTRAGTSLKLWVNGINIDTRTTSGTLGFPASQQTLTRIGGGAGTSVNSYIQDFRIYKGTSKYTTNFLVGSTNPSIVATSPSGIVYNSEPEEQLSRSVDFDGTGDYLSIPVNNSDFDWAAGGSLTIEAFVNMNVIDGQTYNSIINRWNGSGKYSFGLDVKSNGNLFFYRGNGSTITTHESSGITIGLKQWHHIAVVKDGTTGRFFINGQACGTFTWNEAFTNSTSIPLHLGNLSDGNVYPINGRISNARIVNGTAVYTSSFKPPTRPLTNITNTKLLCCNTSSTTGSTVTPGTITANGDPRVSNFNPFGKDTIGYPDLYNTMNDLDANSNVSIKDGGAYWSCTSAGGGNCRSTMSVTSGKWYWESEPDLGNRYHVGLIRTNADLPEGDLGEASTTNWVFRTDGYKVYNGSETSITSSVASRGNCVMIAYDADNEELYFGANGRWAQSSDPVNRTSPAYTSVSPGEGMAVVMGRRTNSCQGYINFGQRPFSYPPPEGFQPITANNLAKSDPTVGGTTVVRPDKYVGITTYVGNGSTGQNITGLKFKPDLLIIKKYSASESWGAFDSIRGVNKRLYTNENHAEVSETTMSAFNEGGFRVEGSGGGSTNDNGASYVGYCWRAGGNKGTWNIDGVPYASAAAAGLSGGDIDSTAASVNTKGGFSILRFEAQTSGSATIKHGMGKKPGFWMYKPIDGTTDWYVYHQSLGASAWLKINSNVAATTSNSAAWGGTEPTTSVLTHGSGLVNQDTCIIYAWADVPGLQKFGSYVGTGDQTYAANSGNNRFIYTGFKPALVIIKSVGTSDHWNIPVFTNGGGKYNGVVNTVSFNLTNAERTMDENPAYDYTSNGFLIRTADFNVNKTATTYIYAAWAESPLNNLYGGMANAR